MVSTNVESLSTPCFVDSGLLFIAFQIYPHPVDRQIVNNRNFPLQSGTPQMKYPNIPIGSEAKGPPVQSTTPITCLRGLVYLIAVRKGAVARSEEHTSELQSLMRISYAVFCLKKKKIET